MSSREDLQRLQQIVDLLNKAKANSGNSNQQMLLTYIETFMGVENPGSLSDEEGIAHAMDAFSEIVSHLDKSLALNKQLQKKLNETSQQAPVKASFDFNHMADVEKKIVKIQAFFRKQLTLKNLEKRIHDARAALTMRQELESPEEGALREFVNQLINKKITPEGFYRLCDSEYKQNVRVDSFKENLKKLGILLSRGQLSRLIMILDEDMEGHISREEYYNALEAYNLSGEKHKSMDSSPYYPFEHRVLFKLVAELKRKDISYVEMYNACDVNDDSRVEIRELKNFVEGLSDDFKFKELHALMNYLDIDKNGIVDRDEFVRQCTKGEQIYRQSQIMAKSIAEDKMKQQLQQRAMHSENNFFEEEHMGTGDQNFFTSAIDTAKGFLNKKQAPPAKNITQTNQKQTAPEATLKPSASNVNLNPDELKRKQIIQKMEKEGQNFQSFFDTIRSSVVGGNVSLGLVLKSIETAYPTVSTPDRNFLVKDCIVLRNKIDYLKLEEIFTKYSQKLRPSVSQTFSVIATNIVKKMGNTPTESIRLFLKAQNLSEYDAVSNIDFNQMFSGKFSTLSKLDLDAAFNSLNLDMDGFVPVNDLVQVLLSYLQTDDKSLSLKDLNQVIPNIDTLSPRTRCEHIIEYLINELQKKNMKPLNVFKMADTKTAGTVSSAVLESTFKKFLPHVRNEIFIEAMSAFRKTGSTQMVTREDFEMVFSETSTASKYIPNSSSLPKKDVTPTKNQPVSAASSKGFTDEEEHIKWVKKLDNAMLREGLSPTVAFNAADVNHNGVITVDELQAVIKKLIPEDVITLAELKKIMMAFDQNRNGIIEKEEFIQVFENARNSTVTVVESPQKGRLQNNQVDDFRKSKLPLKDSIQASVGQTDTVNDAELAQIVARVDKKLNLKKFFADAPINEQGMQLVSQLGRKFKSEQAADGTTLKPSEYLPIIKYLDKGTGLVPVTTIFKFCEKFCPSYISDISLELKYLANFLEFQKSNRNTKQYLTQNTKLKGQGRIMEIELMSELQAHFGISMNVGRVIHQTITKAKGGDLILDDICTYIDQYRQIKLEQVVSSTGTMGIDQLFTLFTIKMMGLPAVRKQQIDKMISECVQKEGAIYFNAFYTIFGEENQVLNPQECKTLFAQWKNSSKTKNSIDLPTFERIQNEQMEKIKNCQEQALGRVILSQGKTLFDNMSKIKYNEQGYISKLGFKEYLQTNEVIQRKGTNPQDTPYIQNLKKQLGFEADIAIPQALQASEFVESLLSSQSENCQIWILVDVLAELTQNEATCDELVFKYLGKALDLLIPGKPSQTMIQLACPDCASINDAKSLVSFMTKVSDYGKRKAQGFDHGQVTLSCLKQIELIYRAIGGRPFRIQSDDNPLMQKINRHRATLSGKNQDPLNDSISQRVPLEDQSKDTIIAQIERVLGLPIEDVLQDKGIFESEQIPITSFFKILISVNSQFDKALAQQLFAKIDPQKSGRVEIFTLIQYLKRIPGKFNKQEVLKRIAENVQEPAVKYLEHKGLKGSSYIMKSDLIASLEDLAAISSFHSVCLYCEYATSAAEDQIHLQPLIDEILKFKTSGVPAKTQPKVAEKPLPKPQPQTEPPIQKKPTISQIQQKDISQLSHKDKFKLKNMQSMAQILNDLRNGLNNPKHSQALMDMFDSFNGKIEIDEFFDFLIDDLGSQASDEQQDKLEVLVDPNRKGRVKIQDFVKFCSDYEINFNVDIQRFKTTTINRKAEEQGTLVKIDSFEYRINPEKDFYRGIPTILNSEEAAIAQCHLLIKQCKGPKFLDKDFGPKDEESFDQYGNKKALYFTGVAPKGYCAPEEIVWLRPERITNEVPKFFSGDAGSNDVKQGQIGDCWFIGALSVIALRDDLLRGGVSQYQFTENFEVDEQVVDNLSKGVVPPIFHLYRIKGMYVMRFFKEFQWRYVIIDDRIPCYKSNNIPVFGRCTDIHELWVPLIEKAYAKLHGCYETLISGFIDDALNDMTGLVAEKIKTHNDQGIFPHKSVGDKEKFWEYLTSRIKEGCMMGCSVTGDVEREIIIDGFRTGIMTGHAYGIIDVFELPNPKMVNPRKTHRLLRVRNPWGKMEWKGKWSDNSDRLRQSTKLFEKYMAALPPEDKFDPFEEDGSFFICYSDWRDIFNSVFVCVDFPASWTGVRFISEWNKLCAGGTPSPMTEENKQKWAKNPQYVYEAALDTEVFISLAQPDGRVQQPDGKYLKFPYAEIINPVCFTICQIPSEMNAVTTFDKSQVKFVSVLKEHREVSLRAKLPKGKYIIVPSCRNPGETGTFTLNIYFNQKPRKIKKIERVDKEEFYDIIKEEDDVVACPDWKIELIQKKIPYMMGGEDNQLNQSILNNSLFMDDSIKEVFSGFEEEKLGKGNQNIMEGEAPGGKRKVKFFDQLGKGMNNLKAKRRERAQQRRQNRIQKRKQQFIDLATALERALNDASKKKQLIDYFEGRGGVLTYPQFFDFLTQTFEAVDDEVQQQELSEEIDIKGSGKIKIVDFYNFCQQFAYPFDADIQKYKTKTVQRKGEELSVGSLTYVIVPKEDCFRGIPTILNSEEAALVVAEKLFNSVPDGQVFFDQDFGPKDPNDVKGGRLSMYFTGQGPKGYRNPDEVVWLRPSDFCHERPQFVDDGAGSNDVRQGEIGDCWFIGALSVLATRDELLRGAVAKLKEADGEETVVDKEMAFNLSKGVYPPIFHKYRKKGIYVLRFYKEFSWRYVIIDDRLPCGKNNSQPIFGRCKNVHELWVPLIEKAYAKLHGCYETLISGFIDDGLSDLTGLVAEKIKIHNDQGIFPHKSIGDKDKFWDYLMERKKENCMMGCSVSGDVERQIMIDGQPSGIMTGHAYGIIDVFELQDRDMANPRKTHRLLRIRNPWGKMEWKGKWADNSDELDKYNDLLREYISKQPLDEKFEPGVEDGTFLMNYSSWRDIYNNIFVCLDFPEVWNGLRFEHEWNAKNSGGTPAPMTEENKKKWAKNPQFLFAPRKNVELFVSLAQPDGRAKREDGKYYKFPYAEIIHPVCFTIVQLRDGQEKAETFDKSQIKFVSILKEHREISLRVNLTPGRYVIVPSTRNAKEFGSFTLSLYFNCGIQKVDVRCLDDEMIQGKIIEEENENYENVPDWKVELVQERLKFMIGDEDEEVLDSTLMNETQNVDTSGFYMNKGNNDFNE